MWQKAESLWQVHPTPRLYSPGGTTRMTVWLHFVIAYALVGGSISKSLLTPSMLGLRSATPSNTVCHWTPQVYMPNGI